MPEANETLTEMFICITSLGSSGDFSKRKLPKSHEWVIQHNHTHFFSLRTILIGDSISTFRFY